MNDVVDIPNIVRKLELPGSTRVSTWLSAWVLACLYIDVCMYVVVAVLDAVVVVVCLFFSLSTNWIIHGKRLFQPFRVMCYFCEWIVVVSLRACKWKGHTTDGKCTGLPRTRVHTFTTLYIWMFFYVYMVSTKWKMEKTLFAAWKTMEFTTIRFVVM